MTVVADDQAGQTTGLAPLPPRVVYLIAARAAMPGYTATQEAARRVRRQVTIAAPAGLEPYPDVDALAAAAAAGQDVPLDLGEQVLVADRAKAAEAARREWTASVARRLDVEAEQIGIRHVDDALRFLDGELQTLLGAARGALRVAAGISTPEAALRAGDEQREAFVQIDELTTRLRDLREAQRTVMRYALDYAADGQAGAVQTDALLRYAGTVANLAEVLPDWSEAQKPGSRVGLPWRPAGPTNRLVPHIDRDHLVWLVESPAVPWVPNTVEARRATDLLLNAEKDRGLWSEQEQKNFDRAADEHAELVDRYMRMHRWQTQAHDHF